MKRPVCNYLKEKLVAIASMKSGAVPYLDMILLTRTATSFRDYLGRKPMGWRKVAELRVQESNEEKTTKPIVWSRGGISEVAIEVQGMWIPIPEEVLMKLLTETYVNNAIRELEDLTPYQAFERMMKR